MHIKRLEGRCGRGKMLYPVEQLAINYCCYAWYGIIMWKREARCKGVIMCINGYLYVCFTMPAVMQEWKRGVVIYSHLAVQHRHYVWPPLFLIYLSLFFLPPASSVLTLWIVFLSFFTPHLPSPPSSHLPSDSRTLVPPCLLLALLFLHWEDARFQLSSSILHVPRRRWVYLFRAVTI